MKIHLRLHNVKPTRVLRAHVERGLGFALSRFGERIGRVTVRLSHAPGLHKRCHIEVDLRLKNVQVEDSDADLLSAFDHAAQRLSRSVARALALQR